jgi:hypothetical protein
MWLPVRNKPSEKVKSIAYNQSQVLQQPCCSTQDIAATDIQDVAMQIPQGKAGVDRQL